jgi:hypothetical protein
MAIKKINTDLQIEAGLLDGDGNSGTANQILISTGTGVDWVDGSGSSIIGGPYLPLSAGSSYPLTDTLYGTKATFGDTNIDVATVTIEGGLAGILDIWRNGTNASYQAIRFRDDTNANTEASIGWGSNQLRLNGTSTIVATTGGSERIRIDSSGNVGIGTTSPSQKLEVAGKLLVDNGNLGSIAGDTIYHAEITGQRHHLDFKEVRTANGSDWPNTTYKLQMRVDSTNHQSIDFVSDANAQEHIDIYTNNQVFNTRFDANGNVGIGTTAPLEPLSVFAGTNESVYDVLGVYNSVTGTSAVGKGAAIRIGKDVDGDYSTKIATIYEGNNPSFLQPAMAFFTMRDTYLKGSEVERMRITSGGNVGIGTDSPSSLLHIKGADPILTIQDTSTSTTNASSTLRLGESGAGGVLDVYWDIKQASDSLNTHLEINHSSNGNRFTILDSGNVGIGTTSPSAKLQVAGTVRYNTQLSTSNYSGQKAFIGISSGQGAQKFKIYKNTNTSDGYARFKIDRAFDYGNNEQMVQEAIFQRRNTIKNFVFKYDGDIATPDDVYLEVYELSNDQVEIWLCVDDYAQPVVEVISNPGTSEIFTSPSAGTPTGTLIYSSNPDTETPNWNSHQGVITATTFLGDLNGTINTTTTGVTQTAGNNSTLIATTAYADAAAAAVDPSGVYLPLIGGTMTGDLLMDGKAGVGNVIGLATGTSSNAMSLKLYTYNNIDPGGGLGTSTGNMIQADLGSNLVLRQTANDGDITFQSDDGAGGIATYLTLDGSSTDAYFSNPGNVGIGVTSPGARLDVAGNGNAIQIRRSNGFASIKAHSDNGGNLVLDSLSTAGAVFLNHYVNRPVYIASGGGNVGIGTTSPVRKLTVNGSANVFDSLLINSNTPTTGTTTDAELVIQAKGNQAGTIRSSQWYFQTIPDSIYGNSAFRIAKNYDGGATSEFMRITSAGNVGIGTTSSDYKLEVNGSLGVSRTDGIVFAGSAGAGTGSKILSNTSNDLIFSTALTSIPYTTTERVRILNNGNVGIGTTSPSAKLEVKDGSIRLNNTSSYPSTNKITATWNGDTSPPMGSIGWEQNPGFIGSEWSHYKQTSPYTQARIRLIGDASSGGMFVNLNGSDVFTIQTSSGNVGIGTTSPSQKLSVSGDATFTGRIYTNTGGLASVGILGKAKTDGWAARYDSNNANFSGFYFDSGNDASLILRDDAGGANVYLQSDSTSYINGGNVGIGTINPSTTLEVVDTFSVQRTSNDNEGFYVTVSGADANAIVETFYQEDSASNYGYRKRYDGSTNLYQEFIHNNSATGTEVYRVDRGTKNTSIANGNVGIGTTSPSYKLDVDGEVRVGDNQKLKLWDNAFSAIITPLDAHLALTTTRAQDNIYFDPGNSTKVVMEAGGNVGIGTTSPNARLQVNSGGSGNISSFQSSATAVGEYAGITLHTQTNSGADWYGSEIRSINTQGTPSSLNPRLGFFTQDDNTYLPANRTEKLSILGSGNVGIGTTSPSSKLHVKDTSLSGTLAYFEASASAQGTTNVRVDCLQYGIGIAFFRDGSVGGGACSFRNDSGTQVGSITIGTSSTSYNTISDYRLKENLISITDGINRLKQLKPKRFNFIGETQIVDGFVAHEAKEVVPESVTGEKDGVLPNGDPVYQGIDQSKIVPLLTAALQEAIAKIEDLENRIQTLENK